MKRWMMAAAVLLFLLGVCGALAQETEEEAVESAINEVLSGVDFASVEEICIELPGEGDAVGVEALVRKFLSGESISTEAIMSSLFNAFFHQLAQLKTLMLSIMLPVLMVSLLSHVLSGEAGEMKTIGRSTGYLFVLVPVIVLIADQLNHTKETILLMTTRMDKLLPMLLTLLTALGGSASSAFLHPVVAAASGSMVFLAREVVLRLVMCTCAVTAVNHLSLSVHLTRMSQLLRSVVCWLLGVSFTVFLGAMSLQGVCSASIDGVAIRAAKYAADNFVPIIGGMFSDTMETLVGCTLIVKNALGVAAAAVLLASLVSPMLGTVASVFVLKLTAALLEPVADGGIVAAIGDFSRTLVLFFVTMLCVATMYFLLIVQVLLVGNLTVMLR